MKIRQKQATCLQQSKAPEN